MATYAIDLDYELADDGEHTGNFHVLAIEDENGDDVTALIDQTKIYADLEQLRQDLAEAKGVTVEEIDLEDMAQA